MKYFLVALIVVLGFATAFSSVIGVVPAVANSASAGAIAGLGGAAASANAGGIGIGAVVPRVGLGLGHIG